MPAIVLKPGRERSLLRRHPWIFSGAIQTVEGSAGTGETVEVLSSSREFLARAAFSPHSQIRARAWTFEDEPVDAPFFRKRIRAALEARSALHLSGGSNALRLVYAEADGIPGLIVDRYADQLVLQSLTAGSEYWKDQLLELLAAETGVENIFERSDADVRDLEGLPSKTGVLCGRLQGPPLVIEEEGLKFVVDVEGGHKTGFYLDQRANRARARALAGEREVLDCFCYTGGFTVSALAGGARSVLAVDSAAGALALARENIERNGLAPDRVNFQEGDVFQVLRRLRDEGRSFDMIILDPPKFAPTAAQAEKAARGYKDINLLAFKLLRRGGLLVTFSCSGGIDAGLFQKIVAGAALDAGVDAQILEHLAQFADHPIALAFPESSYLKGLICRLA